MLESHSNEVAGLVVFEICLAVFLHIFSKHLVTYKEVQNYKLSGTLDQCVK